VRLSLIDINGKLFAEHTVVSELPTSIIQNKLENFFLLEQNYPNPFNPITKIRYFLPIYSKVKITVFDLLGNTVSRIINQYQEKGSYEIEFNSDEYNLASGVYFYRIEALHDVSGKLKVFNKTRKMILLR
jgi:hypothetical protein